MYSPSDISRFLSHFAREKGIIIGTCGAEPLDFPSQGGQDTPFVRHSAEHRANPRAVMKNARGIIVAGVGYGKELDFERDTLPRGRFSAGATGLDYHITVRDILKTLADSYELIAVSYGFQRPQFHISVDTGPLPEKLLAVKAGLGNIGKNGLVISKKLGSFFNIGYMLTNLELPTKEHAPSSPCKNCNICITACPNGALSSARGYDYRRCVSYLTQKKGELTAEEERRLGTWLYGCDICQIACPHNKNVSVGTIENIGTIMPLLSDILALDKEGFVKRYKGTAIFWRGLEVLQRNARIALKNIMPP